MKIKDMSLTDDWKAGKLKAGPYYVKLSNGRVDVAKLSKFNRFYAICYTFEVVEVIAPCSYDHFVELTKKVKKIEKEVVKGDTITGELLNEGAHIKKENRQLRQLLKEVKEKIHNEFINQDIVSIDKFNKILTRITEVLK